MNRSEIVADYKESFSTHLKDSMTAVTIKDVDPGYSPSDSSVSLTENASATTDVYVSKYSKREINESGGAIVDSDVKAILLKDDVNFDIERDFLVISGTLTYQVVDVNTDVYDAIYQLQLRERKTNG